MLLSDKVLDIDIVINLILIFILATNHDCGKWKQHLCDILSFTHLLKPYLKYFCRVNSTFDLNFSCSTGDECKFLSNKNSNNSIIINQL